MSKEVLSFLEKKIRCLGKFRDLTAAFLQSAGAGDWSRLTELEKERSAILKICEQYDAKITKAIEAISPAERTRGFIQALGLAIERKDALIRDIQRIDALFIAEIEAEQQRLAQENVESRKSKNVISKFKSQIEKPLGEGLDKTL